ncbi:MAG: pirin family protein [Acidimicrobiales bacterium]
MGADTIDLVIDARRRELGPGMTVARTLPYRLRRLVGPFVFADIMGPFEFAPGTGIDVPPHPHIGLATVTLLFEGTVLHRDSLGTVQRVRPGDVNWMTAGRGIVHSERTPPDLRGSGGRVHGLQTWVALPRESEQCAPDFEHRDVEELPFRDVGGAQLRVLIGDYSGLSSPVTVSSPLVQADLRLDDGASHRVTPDHEELAVQLISGKVAIGDDVFSDRQLVVLVPGSAPRLRAVDGPAHAVILGGEPLEGPRHIRWNFVASDLALIERAEGLWRENRLGRIAGESDRVPLPD